MSSPCKLENFWALEGFPHSLLYLRRLELEADAAATVRSNKEISDLLKTYQFIYIYLIFSSKSHIPLISPVNYVYTISAGYILNHVMLIF